MRDSESGKTCKACGKPGSGTYCSNCGQAFEVRRISLNGLLQDIIRYLTHFERGFGYTLKSLIFEPGKMQYQYMAGNRVKHQKPFAMFFLCLTIASLVRYWISTALMKYYHADMVSEANFFHQYMVIMYIVLLPVYSLITHLFFYKSGNNYAETGVLMLYALSFVFLISSIISLLVLIWPQMDTAYVEFPVFTLYFILTFMNYFQTVSRREIIIKGVLIMGIAFILNDRIEDFVIGLIARY